MKGYKVTDNNRSRKYGIGANSLKMLTEKASAKFPIKDCRIYLSSDGFEVSDEDYFQTLEPQTLFLVAGPNDDVITDSDFEFQKIRQKSPLLQVADIVQEFIEKNPEKFRKIIAAYEKRKPLPSTEKTKLSLRSEHEEWFAGPGQEERCNSKEEAMARRAQDRIRSYFYKTKEEITKNKLYRKCMKARVVFDKLLEEFRYLLIGCNYFSMLFDRSCERKHISLPDKDQTDAGLLPNKRLRQIIKDYTSKNEILDEWCVSLCSELGEFYCQGAFSDTSSCKRNHVINPYASRENLILFQVWNLDHQIELSRTVIPSLVECVRNFIENPNQTCLLHNRKIVDISVLEYFLEIFSLKNLKLVHIVCHEKVQRTNSSNGHLVCDRCSEYKVLKELMAVSSSDEVNATVPVF